MGTHSPDSPGQSIAAKVVAPYRLGHARSAGRPSQRLGWFEFGAAPRDTAHVPDKRQLQRGVDAAPSPDNDTLFPGQMGPYFDADRPPRVRCRHCP